MIQTCSKFQVSRNSRIWLPRNEQTLVGGACLIDVRSEEQEVSDVVIAEEADKEDWDFDGAMTAAEGNGSGLRGKLHKFHTEFRAVYTNVPAGLVDAEQMCSFSISG